MSLKDLANVVEIPGTELIIWAVRKDVVSYTQFKSAIDLGLQIRMDDLPWDKAILYSWIKEAIESGRKT